VSEGEQAAPRYAVAVGNEGEDDHNTIVLSGVDLSVPLEMDLDDDPLQDDEIRIRSEDGFFEQHVRASDADAEPLVDQRMILYHFRGVPPGVYRIQVNVAGRWVDVIRGLVVRRGGVVHAGSNLTTSRPTHSLGPAAPPPEPPEHDEAPDEESEFMDVNDSFQDR
jgi:hypothetical protein